MGDMADWAFDEEMFARIEFEESMEYLLSDEDFLRQATAPSRNKKIMSIRKWPHPLTHKQKWCLAMWIYNHD